MPEEEFDEQQFRKKLFEALYELESLKHEKDTYFYVSSGLEGDYSSEFAKSLTKTYLEEFSFFKLKTEEE